MQIEGPEMASWDPNDESNTWMPPETRSRFLSRRRPVFPVSEVVGLIGFVLLLLIVLFLM